MRRYMSAESVAKARPRFIALDVAATPAASSSNGDDDHPSAWRSRLAADRLSMRSPMSASMLRHYSKASSDAPRESAERLAWCVEWWPGDRFELCGYRTSDVVRPRSKRSRFMTLSHAATKSRTNFSSESSHA